MEGGQHVGFAFEVLYDGLTHQRVRRRVDHFLNCHQFCYIREVHVAGAVYRPHAANTDHFLDCIAIGKRNAGLKLTWSV